MKTKNWNIDTAHSSINFSVRHMVFAKVRGRFATWKGALELGEDLARSKVKVTIDAGSIDTGVGDRDQHLRSADFLDTDTFPELTFVSKKVEGVSGDHLRVIGDLTIRDVTREVVLDVQHGGRAKDPWGNQRVAFSATTSIDRKAFGLAWNQVLETGGVLVGETIDIELEIQAVADAASAAA